MDAVLGMAGCLIIVQHTLNAVGFDHGTVIDHVTRPGTENVSLGIDIEVEWYCIGQQWT